MDAMTAQKIAPGSPSTTDIPVIGMTPVQSASNYTIPTNASGIQSEEAVYSDREGVGDQDNYGEYTVPTLPKETTGIKALDTPNDPNVTTNGNYMTNMWTPTGHNGKSTGEFRKQSTLDPEMEKMYQIQPQKPEMHTPVGNEDGDRASNGNYEQAQGVNVSPKLPKFDNNWGYDEDGNDDEYEYYDEYEEYEE